MGEDVDQYDFLDLLEYFERDGLVLGGGLGVSPTDVYEYFAGKPGYSADLMYGSEISIDKDEQGNVVSTGPAYAKADEFDSLIVTVWNNGNDMADGMHFITISKDDTGKYVTHNGYDGDIASEKVEDVIAGLRLGFASPISMIGVRKHEE